MPIEMQMELFKVFLWEGITFAIAGIVIGSIIWSIITNEIQFIGWKKK